MKKVLKWIGIVLGVLIALVVAAFLFLFISGQSQLNKTYDVQVQTIEIPDDLVSIERGAHIAAYNCSGCHGEDYSGGPFFEDPTIGYIPSSNLTPGGAVGMYSDEDWVKALRHGIGPDGKSLVVMPSQATYYYSDEDLGALIAYLKSLPPVDNEPGTISIKPVGVLLVRLGMFGDVFAAELIDHDAPRPSAPEPGVSAAYGEYLVNVNDCRACHGSDLSGGTSPDPESPPGTDLTQSGILGAYSSAEDFIEFFRSGITPYNKEIDNVYMPWEHFGLMTDEELSAIFEYLNSLP
jgi:mono/diheme cytochrome c family protein